MQSTLQEPQVQNHPAFAWNKRIALAVNGMDLSLVQVVSRIVPGKLMLPPVLWAEVK